MGPIWDSIWGGDGAHVGLIYNKTMLMRVIYGAYVGFIWVLHGACMVFLWYSSGVQMGQIWDFNGGYMGFACCSW